jgi:hypothetical protein
LAGTPFRRLLHLAEGAAGEGAANHARYCLSMWFALVVAVVGATGNNLGKALQKRAVAQLPRLRLERNVLKQYLRSRAYLVGLAADILGALLNVVALASAPVGLRVFDRLNRTPVAIRSWLYHSETGFPLCFQCL